MRTKQGKNRLAFENTKQWLRYGHGNKATVRPNSGDGSRNKFDRNQSVIDDVSGRWLLVIKGAANGNIPVDNNGKSMAIESPRQSRSGISPVL